MLSESRKMCLELGEKHVFHYLDFGYTLSKMGKLWMILNERGT